MNSLESAKIRSPNGIEEECAKFIIDDISQPFILHGITNVGQQYTFGVWLQSSIASNISIEGFALPASTEWVKQAVTFTAIFEDLEIYFDSLGTYYFYHSQLEIGNKDTDYRPNPDDVEEDISEISQKQSEFIQSVENITLRVTEMESVQNEQESRLVVAEAAIALHSDEIALTVKKDGIISAINQSAEMVAIQANRIKLEGLVTANENFKVLADGSIEAVNGKFTGTVIADHLTANTDGTIACWTINNSCIYRTNSTFGNANGMYFGEKGLSISDKFVVNSNGDWFSTVIADGGDVIYTISAEAEGVSGFVITANIDGVESIIMSQEKTTMGGRSVAFYADYIMCQTIGNGAYDFKLSMQGGEPSSFFSGLDVYGELNTDYINAQYDIIVNREFAVEGTADFNGETYINDELYLNTTGCSLWGTSSEDGEKYRMLRNDEGIVKLGNTKQNLRFYSVNVSGGLSLPTSWSDERLKKDFESLEKYESVFMALEPTAYKYIMGNSGRVHIGIKAQNVKKALEDNNLTLQDFAGICETKVDSETRELYKEVTGNDIDFDTMYEIRYNEFTMLNTYMIQKLFSRIEELKSEITILTAKSEIQQQLIDQLRGAA